MRLRTVLIACSAIFAVALPLLTLAAGSEIDSDLKKLKKYAAPRGDQPHVKVSVPCVCLERGTEWENAFGSISYRRTAISGSREKIELGCTAYLYGTTTGSREGWVFCEDWLPLPR